MSEDLELLDFFYIKWLKKNHRSDEQATNLKRCWWLPFISPNLPPSFHHSHLLQVWTGLSPGSMFGFPTVTTCGPWHFPINSNHAPRLYPSLLPRPGLLWFCCMASGVVLLFGPKTWTLSPAAGQSTLWTFWALAGAAVPSSALRQRRLRSSSWKRWKNGGRRWD